MKTSLLILLMLVLNLSAHSQNVVTLKGKVTDKATGEPLIGVTVIEENADNRILNGTTSDVNGNFTLVISSADPMIRVSYIGYKTISLRPGGQSFLNLVLEENLQTLQEVVVTAESKRVGGLNPVASRDLTGSVEAIDMKDLEDVKVTNLGEMLQGRSSNVDIMSHLWRSGSRHVNQDKGYRFHQRIKRAPHRCRRGAF